MDKSSHFKGSNDSASLKSKNSKLKNAFGKAKLFEIQRIVRRIKQLSLKKGTEQQLQKNKRKVTRLETQLEVVKDTNINTFIEAVDKEDDKKTSSENQESLENVQQLVISKILNMVKQQTTKQDAQEKANSAKKLKVTSSITSNKKRDNSKKKKFNKETVTALNDFEMSEQVNKSAISSMDSVFVGSLNIDETEKTDVKKKISKMNKDYFSSSDVEMSDSEHSEKPRGLSRDSMFVGSLRDRKERRDKKTMKRKERNETGNRLGQRKRRQQWAKLYGKTANHLKMEKKNKEILNKNKRKVINGKEREEIPKKSKCASDLHPSWEASKSKRKQESIVAFQGQKITFDD